MSRVLERRRSAGPSPIADIDGMSDVANPGPPACPCPRTPTPGRDHVSGHRRRNVTVTASVDMDRDGRLLTRAARGVRRRRSKDRPAGRETQARSTDRFYTFAPAAGEGACDGDAAEADTPGDTWRQVRPAGKRRCAIAASSTRSVARVAPSLSFRGAQAAARRASRPAFRPSSSSSSSSWSWSWSRGSS